MQTYDISVIVPVFNGESYIEQCIQSILDQTKDSIEIIVVNDGSTDRTYDIVKELADRNGNIRIISKENGGLKTARINGYLNSQGKYIGWVDADDYIDSRMYETLYRLAEDNEAELVYCNYSFFPSATTAKVKWYKPYKDERNWEYLDKNTQFWNKLFKKELLERIQLVRLLEEYGEYAPILPMMEAKKVISTDQELYHYRVGHNSMSGGSFLGKVSKYKRDVEVTAGLKEMIADRSYKDSLDSYFDYRYIYTLILLAIVAAKNNDKKEFTYARKNLKKMEYLSNPYLWKIISTNYGFFRCNIMTRIIPRNYFLARIVVKFGL